MRSKGSAASVCSNGVQWVAALVALAVFAFLSIAGLFLTCHIDIGYNADISEHVTFRHDSILMNVSVLLVLFVFALLLQRARIQKRTVQIVTIGSLILTAFSGAWWVLSAHVIPTADSSQIIAAAQLAANNQPGAAQWNPYFMMFPFQTGYMLFAEGFFRIFGVQQITFFQLSNVLFVCAGMLAVMKTTHSLFDDWNIDLFAAVLLGLCSQPVYLSTFLYGTLPGMALSLWSIYFAVRAMREGRLRFALWAAILIGVAIMLKRNFSIVLIAELILLLLYIWRTKRAKLLIGVAMMVVLSSLLPYGAKKQYELRANMQLGKGTPQLAWLVMGLRESALCYGWFNSYTLDVLVQNDMDYEKALKQSKEDVMTRVEVFLKDPVYFARFMFHKVVSQWNEPEFQSIWSSASALDEERSAPITSFTERFGKGDLNEIVFSYYNQIMQFVYASMTIGFFVLLTQRKERDEARLIIPMVLIGAALYHALFEAKSQYAIIYIPMMLPFSAYGIKKLSEMVLRKKLVQGSAE